MNFAEDQIWAKKMIELGFKKLYCPYAPVYHSHNYKLSTYFTRYFDEYKGLYYLQNFRISTSWFKLPLQVAKHILADAKYIRHLDMTKKEKIYWCKYSVCRNLSRYYGGYLGGKYDSYPAGVQKWLDRRVSQQYKQRKA